MKKCSVVLMAVGLLLLGGCGKYEEGPRLSFRTKKGRLTNDWKIEEAYRDAQLHTDSLNTFRIEFLKDGQFVHKDFASGQPGDTVERSGTWAFEVNGEQLLLALFDENFPTQIETAWLWDIVKLKSAELWVRETDSLHAYEYHFIPVE